jgi:hypothetical protein
MLKAHLVRDETFAQLSRHFGWPDQLICDPASRPVLLQSLKTTANLFESYTAALFQSYLFGYGSDDATSVPLPPSPDTSAVYGYEYGSPSNQIRKRTNGQALDMVEAWLKPVFMPLAQHVLGEMKRAQASWSSAVAYGDDDDEDRMAQGAAAVLNEHFIGKLHSIKPTFEEVPNKDPTLKAWRMRCIATDREGVQ